MRIAITGTSRGIGLELTRQLLERGDTVEAAAREPEGPGLSPLALRFPKTLRLHRCEVSDEASVAAFARGLGDAPVDILINNAGVSGQWESLERLDLKDVERTLHVNAVAPLRVTRALLPALRRGTGRKVVHISSLMGSIADNTSGGAYAYRMSKAALNMANRSMAIELRPEGIVCAVLHPGWVQTDMGGTQAPVPVAESARGLLRVLDGLTPEHSGGFLDFRGQTLPW